MHEYVLWLGTGFVSATSTLLSPRVAFCCCVTQHTVLSICCCKMDTQNQFSCQPKGSAIVTHPWIFPSLTSPRSPWILTNPSPHQYKICPVPHQPWTCPSPCQPWTCPCLHQPWICSGSSRCGTCLLRSHPGSVPVPGPPSPGYRPAGPQGGDSSGTAAAPPPV